MNLLLTLISVLLICTGQVLFKAVGLRLAGGESLLSVRAGGLLLIAFGIYGLATIMWVYVLRTVPLSKAYPFMALSFVLVPAAGALVFSEQIKAQYVIGSALIVVGVLLAVRA